MLRALSSLTATAVALPVLAPSAFGQSPEPGVTVDPDSPAAKEYALPVGKARQDAAGTKKKRSSSDAPLFGQGVKPSGKSSSSSKSSGSSASSRSSGSSGSSGSSSSGSSGSSGTTASSSSGDSGSGASATPSSSKKSSSGSDDSSSSSSAGATTTDDTTTDQAAPPTTTDPSSPDAAEVAQVAAQANQPSAGGGIGPTVVMGAIGLLVLLAGGAAGLAMRLRGADPTP